jgi:NAD+ kinase
MTRAMLITHTHPDAPAGATSAAVAAAAKAAQEASAQLISTRDELEKHGDAAAGIEAVEDGERPDVCVVLGGDGSILYALRRFAETGVPVFGINFGTVGFLAAVEREELDVGLKRAFGGDYERMDLPALRVDLPVERPVALNDVSFVRRPHGRVAELSYAIGGEEVGSVRCDGLVAATPAGSTGYNLANAGPILAWGEGLRGQLHRAAYARRSCPGGRTGRRAAGQKCRRSRAGGDRTRRGGRGRAGAGGCARDPLR